MSVPRFFASLLGRMMKTEHRGRMVDARDMIIALRGGIPELCSFCRETLDHETAVPEEGGEWACRECWDRFEESDGRLRSEAGHS